MLKVLPEYVTHSRQLITGPLASKAGILAQMLIAASTLASSIKHLLLKAELGSTAKGGKHCNSKGPEGQADLQIFLEE